MSKDSEPVSPADTIRRYIRLQSVCNAGMEPEQREALAALDALLAVGERDKAERERMRVILDDLCDWAQHVGAPEGDRIHFIVEEAAAVLAGDSPGERDRQHIAQLTERLEDVKGDAYLWMIGELDAEAALQAIVAPDAVLADKEDAE